jgi:hypothetical protein
LFLKTKSSRLLIGPGNSGGVFTAHRRPPSANSA